MIVAGFGFRSNATFDSFRVLLKIQDLNANFLNLW